MHQASCCCLPTDLLTLFIMVAILLEPAGGEGAPGTEAQNFECVIYDAAFLNCSWAAGPRAPPDVQYFLFIASHRARGREHECPLYASSACGLHTGCHTHDLSALGSLNYFRVNGSSREGDVRELLTRLSAKRIERLRPPAEVHVSCEASSCLITWSQPQTWVPLGALDLHYQVLVQPQSSQNTDDLSGVVDVQSSEHRRLVFPSPRAGAPQVVRVRAGDVRGPNWSAWSTPVGFSCEESLSRAWLLLLAAPGSLLCALVLRCATCRMLRGSDFCAPGPNVTEEVTQFLREEHHHGNWQALAHLPNSGPIMDEDEHVLVVVEVSRKDDIVDSDRGRPAILAP